MTSATQRGFRDGLLAICLCLLSLLAGSGALLLAEFGAPRWVFAILFGFLLTAGSPTLGAVLVAARVWRGPSFLSFLVSAAVFAFLCQFAAVIGIRLALDARKRRLGR